MSPGSRVSGRPRSSASAAARSSSTAADLPLVRLAHLLVRVPAGTAPRAVVVYSERGRSVALAWEKIVDIVEDSLDTRSDLDDSGLTGSAVNPAQVHRDAGRPQAILAADLHFFDAIEGWRMPTGRPATALRGNPARTDADAVRRGGDRMTSRQYTTFEVAGQLFG